MLLTSYKLHFLSPLHISDHRNDGSYSLRTIQSDTMYAALTYSLASTGTKIPSDGELPFTLSSLFPYYQKVLFLPIPLGTTLVNTDDPSMFKKIKRVKWVDLSLYGDILNGSDIGLKSEDFSALQGDYLTNTPLHKDINGKPEFIFSELMQRASIPDRTGEGDAIPFYMDRITFYEDSGLYFLAEGNLELLEKGLKILSLEGIGSDKNVGMGSFSFEKTEIDIKIPNHADYAVSLSLFIPENKEQLDTMLDGEFTSYDFARRGGWISDTTLRKNVVYGFLPGSIFKVPGKGMLVAGKTVDLKPQVGSLSPTHPVWRCGKSFFLPIMRG